MRKLLLCTAVFLLSTASLLAQRTITGTVTDDKGTPLPNVSVVAKNTSVGTATKADGSYSLTVPASATTLVFTIVGQTPVEQTIGSQSVVNASLASEATQLSEVLVVAYGTAKKRTFTGSATVLRSEDINKFQISSFTRALEGAVPGVQVTSGSGQPGSGSAIRIRGIGSINASAAPLYVVDGIPYGGDFNSINSADIESLSVLKDAASTALYGARGANGVILITTKRGKGKARVELQTRYGLNQRAFPDYDVTRDPAEFLQIFWQSLRNEAIYRTSGALTPSAAGLYASQAMYDASHLNNYKQYSVPAGQQVIDPVTGKLNTNASLLYYDDWEDEMYNNNTRQEHIATISGASDRTQYYMSFGYLNDKGYMVKTDFDRITTRLRVDQQVTNWFKGGINITYARTNQNNTQAGNSAYQNAFFFTRNVAPTYPIWVRDASGNFVFDSKGQRVYDFGSGTTTGSMGSRTFGGSENPRATLDKDIRRYEADNTSTRTYVEIAPLKELKITLNHGMDISQSITTTFLNPLVGFGAGFEGSATKTDGRFVTHNLNQLVNYTPSFGDHNFDLLLGHESYKLTDEGFSANKQGFLFPDDPLLSSAHTVNDATSTKDKYNVEGYFSQLRYDFDNKYFVSGSIRRDGSSRFKPGNKWGTFWSTGIGWNISSEKFMERFRFLDYLKLKFSIGEKGNDNLNYVGSLLTGTNYYPYSTQYVVQTTGSPNLVIGYRGNENITWEINKDFNYGIEFGILKSRITGSFEIFKRTTTDMLFTRPLAFSTGIQSIPDNIGDMYNKGWEAELTVDVLRTKDLTWKVSANATHWYNRMTKLPPENTATGIVTGNFKYLPGHSIYEYFTWEFAGVDQSNGLSLWYKDVLGPDGKPTGRTVTSVFSEATRYYTNKSATPDIVGGVSTQVNYKGFDFSVLTSFGIGGWVYDGPYQSLMYAGGGDINVWHKDILKAWTPNGPNTSVPRLQENYQDANSTSTRWLTKSDYFNIRNIQVGYTLRDALKKLSITSVRFYVVADNVWLNSKRQGLDPRQDFSGGVFNVYSPIRTISAGLNVTF